MKIFYGVQGTGNGHIARARVMAKELKSAGIDVQFLLQVVQQISILTWQFLVIMNYEQV